MQTRPRPNPLAKRGATVGAARQLIAHADSVIVRARAQLERVDVVLARVRPLLLPTGSDRFRSQRDDA